MVDILLQIGAAKLVVSAMLAGVAWVVQRRVGNPAVVHPLWLLVLVALLLPAVVSLPVLPSGSDAAAVIVEEATQPGEAAGRAGDVGAGGRLDERGEAFLTLIANNGKPALAIVWLAVTALLLVWTLVRALRFRHWLLRTSRPAPPELRHQVAETARSLGLTRVPAVHATTARVSPMVCWTGGRVRLVIPSFLLASLDRQELRAVLAHELAHVRRRDHLVRWMEWLACAAFWWNPLAWWARRELRAAEEVSCDAIGAAAIGSSPRAYAKSLLRILEVMAASPRPGTPAFASGVACGRDPKALERRLRVLISGTSTDRAPRWIRATGAVAAVCLLPLGLVYCHTDSPAADLAEPSGGDPVYTYWAFDSSNGHIGPQALADAPVQPVECRLRPDQPDEQARSEAMAACARAISRDLRETDNSDDLNVCVSWGSRASGWRGICESWEPRETHRLWGNSRGSVLLERVVVAGRTR